MADESRRVDIGFQGGQVLPARVKQSAYDELRKALSEERSDALARAGDEDSDVSVDLSQVVYVRIDTEEQRVGF